MSILKQDTRETNSTASSHLIKNVAVMAFSIMMITNAPAQTHKNTAKKNKAVAPVAMNYGWVKDSLKTYLMDCFIKEIMDKNTPEKIRATIIYLQENSLTGDEATDYILWELITKNNAENIKCEYQAPALEADSSVVSKSAPNNYQWPVNKTTTTIAKDKKNNACHHDTDFKASPTVISDTIVAGKDTVYLAPHAQKTDTAAIPIKDVQKANAEGVFPHQTAEKYGWIWNRDRLTLAGLAKQNGYLDGQSRYTWTAQENLGIQKFLEEKKFQFDKKYVH